MTDYTPAQQKLIDEHRHWNVEGIDWFDSTLEDFCNVALSFGIHVRRDDVQFSGFWSQGDGASFTFVGANAYNVIMAAIKVEQEKPYGEEPTGYVAAFAALGKLLLDAFSPYVLTCPEGREIAESYCFNAQRISHHYSHSNTVSVRAEFEHTNYDCNEEGARQGIWNALANKLWGVGSKLKHEREPSLEDELDEAVKAIADALYKWIEEEYDYLTSDEAVWESLEANGVTEDDDDDEDEDDDEEELTEAA